MINFGFGDFLGRVGEGAVNAGESIGAAASQGVAGGGNYALDIMKAYDQGQKDYVETQGALQKQKQIDFEMINAMEDMKYKPGERAIKMLDLMQGVNLDLTPKQEHIDRAFSEVFAGKKPSVDDINKKASLIEQKAIEFARQDVTYDPTNPLAFAKSIRDNNVRVVTDREAAIEKYSAEMALKEQIENARRLFTLERDERNQAHQNQRDDKAHQNQREIVSYVQGNHNSRFYTALADTYKRHSETLSFKDQENQENRNFTASENNRKQANAAVQEAKSKYQGWGNIKSDTGKAQIVKNIIQSIDKYGEAEASQAIRSTFAGTIKNFPNIFGEVGGGKRMQAPKPGAMNGVAAPKRDKPVIPVPGRGVVDLKPGPGTKDKMNAMPVGSRVRIQGKIVEKRANGWFPAK